jgi:hypothetical protein
MMTSVFVPVFATVLATVSGLVSALQAASKLTKSNSFKMCMVIS